MLIKNTVRIAAVALALSTAMGCVTINVNFPEGAAQKASDDFVKELYRARDRKDGGAEPAATPTPSAQQWWHGLILAEAWAEDAFKVSSPKITALRDRLAKRLDEMLAHKRAGYIGEDNVGLLIVKDPAAVKPMLLPKVKKLVADENTDRADLYAEIARINGLKPAAMKDLGRTFGHSFQAESPAGTWIQADNGDWKQK